MSEVALENCPVCQRLDTYYCDELMQGGLSDSMRRLLGEPPYAWGEGTAACPLCGTFYRYDYECEFGAHSVTVWRIGPLEAGARVDVDRFTRELSAGDASTRDYAALALVELHLARGEVDAVIGLLTHVDATVRLRAVSTLLVRRVDLRPYLLHVVAMMFDDDQTVRCTAGAIGEYGAEAVSARRGEVEALVEARLRGREGAFPQAEVFLRTLRRSPFGP